MNNISGIRDCYGCGVCATACGRKVIDIQLNAKGFYEPVVTDVERCTECGICRAVCSFLHDDIALKSTCLKSYAAWSNDRYVRRKSSSGGAGFEIGKYLLNEGYKVCGVRYIPERTRAEHFVATTKEELVQSMGSKYIQSYTLDAFKSLNRKEKYLVTGTPCQIDSFRRYVRKFRCEENFILLDFFCHGVPSLLMWQKYSEWAEQQVGTITYASWRNKWNGWHDSWAMGIDGKEHGEKIDWHDSYNLLIRGKKSFLQSRWSKGDMFYALFLGHCCMGKQCYEHCKFKYNHSSADIRIGDMWGETYQDDSDGVSCAIAFTEKGDELLKHVDCTLTEYSLEVVAEGQLRKSPAPLSISKRVEKCLQKSDSTIKDAYAILLNYRKRQRLLSRLKNPFQTMNNILKRLRK